MKQSEALKALLARARQVRPTPAHREQQRRSFAYGNLAIEDGRVSKAFIDRVADQLENGR